MTTLNPDGPHSPELTREAASQIAEMVRFLVYATRSGETGLQRPADACDLLGTLAEAIGGFPQLLDQVGAGLRADGVAGRLADTHRDDAALWARVVARDLTQLGVEFGAVAHRLSLRQGDISGLYLKDGHRD